MENQQGPAVDPKELCSASRASLDGRGAGGVDPGMCVAECLRCSPETAVTLLVGSAPHKIKRLSGSVLGAGVPVSLARMEQCPPDPPPEAQTPTGATWPRFRRLKREIFEGVTSSPKLTAPLKGRMPRE